MEGEKITSFVSIFHNTYLIIIPYAVVLWYDIISPGLEKIVDTLIAFVDVSFVFCSWSKSHCAVVIFDFFFTGSSKNINQILISRNIWAVWINASITLFLFFCEEIDVHDLTLLHNVMRWWYSFFKSLREQRSLIWYYNFLMFFCFDESVIIKAFLAD